MEDENIMAGGEEVLVDAPPVPSPDSPTGPPPAEMNQPDVAEDVLPEAGDDFLPAVPAEDTASFLPDPEPEVEDALMIFNREWNKKLEEKRATEFETNKQVRTTAEEELSSWNQQRGIRMQAKAESNRTEEQVKVEQLNSEADALKTWERVSTLIDVGEGSDNKGSDTSRMRKLFIHLKNEPLEVTRAASAVA
mmetsp:Transcript_23994/g.66720  ORF Transcript_23994/g.66720 Transcript_23994/m.66720 type:complete len:193 (-) Transcript_23994:93-671(-)